MDGHSARCVDAAADGSAASSSSTADACLAGAASNAFGLMMRPSNVKARAVAANKITLEAEQAKDTLKREVQDLERKMKRQRTDIFTTEDNQKMPADVGDLDLADHCRHATRWWNRSQVQLGSLEDAPALRIGEYGYVNHPRLGLIGCLAYWARGSMAHADTMIAALCVKLGISERVRDALPETTATREAETNAKIVALLKTGLGELKHCRNEQQRIQFLVGLSLVMPPRMEEDDSQGWIRRITHVLAVKHGKRTAKYDEEWNPTQDVDASQLQVAMLINSLELHAAGFTLTR